MIPKSISYTYYQYPKLYNVVMYLLIAILFIEGYFLENNWLYGAGWFIYGVKFADRYRDNKAVKFAHYFYAAGWAGLMIGATDISILYPALVALVLFLVPYLIKRKWNWFLLMFELTLFGASQYNLLQ